MKMRKNIRLKGYDYSSKGFYFITICVKNLKHIFGELVNNKMIFNKNGYMVNSVVDSFRNDNFIIDYYQIMPNHVHLIVQIRTGKMVKLSQIVSSFKSKCTNLVKISGMWQRGYYERVIRDQKEYDNIVKYIHENPFRDKYQW